jgi:putative flippase GtrA
MGKQSVKATAICDGAQRKTALRRWLVFNIVGAFGLVVQVATLAAIMEWTACNYLWATAIAVEAAVIHNFLWHERWTWADRATGIARERLSQFLRFQLTNALAPMIGNLFLMRLLVGHLGMRPILANLLAVAFCSIFTFFAGDRLVFSEPIGTRLWQKSNFIR